MIELELDAYQLKLMERLMSFFPDLAEDEAFFNGRVAAAKESYTKALNSGASVGEAVREADTVLYSGLYFSPFATIMEVLQEHFDDKVSSEEMRSRAIELMPLCEPVFGQFDIDDLFETSLEYENELLPQLKKIINLNF